MINPFASKSSDSQDEKMGTRKIINVEDEYQHIGLADVEDNPHEIDMELSESEDDSSIVQHKISTLSHVVDGTSIIGVKRSRLTHADQQPSVFIKYDSLTRSSKQKLEELLQHWSEWHAQHCSLQSSSDVLESGEDTYFPAVHFGLETCSAMSYWIDSETRKEQNNVSVSLDSNTVPVYDREFALSLGSPDGASNIEGALEIVRDASRCFNCESYSHSLKDCPKPRDNAAVNNARGLYKSKQNKNKKPGARIPTRYYQNTAGGKYDGLIPGALDAETRQLLGLGELDPPPWLNRMRELGYPPGYLGDNDNDNDNDNDRPSGITIFGDEDIKEETKDTEVSPEKQEKMTVKFPGVNAPIPEKADKTRWASEPPTSDRLALNSSTSEAVGRGEYYEQSWLRVRDDGPPGVVNPSMYSCTAMPRNYGPAYPSCRTRDNIQIPSNHAFEMSIFERARSLVPEKYNPFDIHGLSHLSAYSFPNGDNLPRDFRFGKIENGTAVNRIEPCLGYSYRSGHESDKHLYARKW